MAEGARGAESDGLIMGMSFAELDARLAQVQDIDPQAIAEARARLREYARLLTSADEMVQSLDETLQALEAARKAVDLMN
jgi:hypothetical protein